MARTHRLGAVGPRPVGTGNTDQVPKLLTLASRAYAHLGISAPHLSGRPEPGTQGAGLT